MIWLVLGIAVIAFVSVDFLLTTVGAAPWRLFSHRVAGWAFAALRAARRNGSDVWFRLAGPVVMTAVAGFWVVGLSVGWMMVFSAAPAGLVDPDGDVVGPVERYAHVGHLLSTLGSGAVQPDTVSLYVAGMIAGVSGMVVLTLSVSFVLSTAAAVAAGRAFTALLDVYDPASEAGQDALLPPLAALVAQLAAAPFALHYSSPMPERRVAARLAGLPEAAGGARGRYERVLKDLPHLREDLGAIGRWAEEFELDG